MLIQLSNGKTVEMSFEEWDNLTDNELNYRLATNQGEEINDPFYGSILKNPKRRADDDDEIELIEEIEIDPDEETLFEIEP